MQIQTSRDPLFSRYAPKILHLETICSRSPLLQFTFKNMMKLRPWIESAGTFSSGLVFLCWTEIRLAPPFPSAAAAGKVSELSLEQQLPPSPIPSRKGERPALPLLHLNIPYPLLESSVSGYIEQGNATSFTALLRDTGRGKKSSGSYPGKD